MRINARLGRSLCQSLWLQIGIGNEAVMFRLVRCDDGGLLGDCFCGGQLVFLNIIYLFW